MGTPRLYVNYIDIVFSRFAVLIDTPLLLPSPPPLSIYGIFPVSTFTVRDNRLTVLVHLQKIRH